jgi:hypothetical protein
MDGKHEGLSDEALAREIEAALGVDPSPEFLPRVRTRIASERMQEGNIWSISWRWAGAVVVVAPVAVLAVWTLRDPEPELRKAATTPPVEEAALSSPEPVRQAPARGASNSETPKPVRVPAARTARHAQPAEVVPFEVVIAPDEAAALRQLFTAISNRRIEPRALPDLQSALEPPDPIEEIVLEPITISPLAAFEAE